MKNSGSSPSAGIGFFGALQIAFIVLKLIGKISWPWWMVFIPMYASAGIVVFALLICLVLALK